MIRTLLLALALAALVVAGCASTPPRRAPSLKPAPAPVKPAPGPPSQASCHARAGGALPDPACTPGAFNPAVTQADVSTTVCVRGWTSTIRPPTTYTEPLKRRQIAAYGYADVKLGDYEEDHLIPLELGGAPSDPRNLWPEPHQPAVSGAFAKDNVENALRADVCAGRVTLDAARRAIATDWRKARVPAGY